MLFYPDQYFYQNSKARPREERQPSSRRQFTRGNGDGNVLFYEGEDLPFGGASRRAQRQERPSAPSQEQYFVLDEDEFAALQAYRRQKRAQAEQAARREAFEARRKAEAERRYRELARQEAEARMRAQIEANARAAAREYYRRKQAQQLALQQAQQEERQRRQQLVLEQLRNHFGLFTIPRRDSQPEYQSGEGSAEQDSEQNFRDARTDLPQQQEQPSQDQSEGQSQNQNQNQNQEEEEQQQQQQQQQEIDPIRILIEALAPIPLVFNNDSSDEEEPEKQSRQGAQEEDSDNDSEAAAPSKSGPYGEDDDFEAFEDEGPTCETASEDSEPAFVEFRDPLANPPAFADSVDSDEDAAAFTKSRKDRLKERQAKTPKSKSKKTKLEEQKQQQSLKEDSVEPSATPLETTPAETVGLLHALEDDLQRLSDGYERLSSLPAATSYREAVTRLEGIKIGYRRTEEIYVRLDRVRVGKDERKLKHRITNDSVALADKYEKLLQDTNEVKRELSKKERAEQQSTQSPKHQVVLEEVQDDSE